jgi:hypothetical protein
MSQREADMGFLDGVKSKLGEAKQGITDMNDRRKASSLVSDFASYPLCSASDAWTIIESGFTKYLGRYYVALIDLEKSSPEEVAREMAELDAVTEKERLFLSIVLAEDFRSQLFTLRGSVCTSFFNRVLAFLEDTEMEIDKELYEQILTVMIQEASGFDMYLYCANERGFDIYDSHREFKAKYFPKVSFPKLEETARHKFDNYNKTYDLQQSKGDNSIASALMVDQIDIGRDIDIYDPEENTWSKGLVGAACVPRMVEYYLPPRMLRKQVVASIYNLTNEMTTVGGGVHWHFCEDGILQVESNGSSQPRWISKANFEGLTFGEGYNGLTKDGRTEFEHFYLYMTVETATGDEFTLFRFLDRNRKNAERNFNVYMSQTLPMIADHFPVYTSDNVYDISKHYKTTYTTTYVWGEF